MNTKTAALDALTIPELAEIAIGVLPDRPDVFADLLDVYSPREVCAEAIADFYAGQKAALVAAIQFATV